MNVVGLKRRGHSRDAIRRVRQAYRTLFLAEGAFRERVEVLAAEFANDPLVGKIIAFIRDGGSRPLMMAQAAGGAGEADESAPP